MKKLWFVAIKNEKRFTIQSIIAETHEDAIDKVLKDPLIENVIAYQRIIRIRRSDGPKSHKSIWINLNEQN